MKYARDKALAKAQTALLLHKRWAYLRYLHLQQGMRSAGPVDSVLAVGCGRGVAEVALALEHPDVTFHLTDIKTDRTPNFQQAERMVDEWGIPNVTFAVLDILDPKDCPRFDLVTSVEVLEHIEPDAAAAKAITALARKAVFTLVPFSDAAANADPQRRQRVWENNEHYRVGYDEAALRELFPSIVSIRGAYWADGGMLLRQRLTDLAPEQIRADAAELQQLALSDIRPKVPQRLREAAGIWCLSSA